jgi:O-antigen ligase
VEQATSEQRRYWSAAVALAAGGYALSWSWSESLQRVGNVVFWVFTCVIAAAFLLRASGSLPARRWLLAVAVLGGSVALSALWSVAPSDTVREAVKFAAVLLTAGSVGSSLQSTASAAESLAGGLAWLAPAAIGLTAIVAAVGLLDASDVPGPGASGFFNGPNVLSIFLALTLPFLLTRRGVAARPAVALGTLGVVTFTATLSAGRTGVLALILAVVAIGLGTRRPRRLALDLATCVAAIVLASAWSPAVPALGEHIVVNTDAAPTATQPQEPVSAGSQSTFGELVGARDEAWAEGFRLLDERPFAGHGFGTGTTLFDRYGSRDRFTYFVGAFASGTNPHNSYLQMLLELGIAGGILFLAPILLALVLAARILIGGHGGADGLAFCATLVAAAVAAFFESTLTQFGALTLLSWIAAAAVIALWLRTYRAPVRRD